MATSLLQPGGSLILDAYGCLAESQINIFRAVTEVVNARLQPGIKRFSIRDIAKMVAYVRAEEFSGQDTPQAAWHSLLVAEISIRRHRHPADLLRCPIHELITALAIADMDLYVPARLMPGAVELMGWAQASSFRPILCTNVTQAGLATLHRLGLLGMFKPGDIAASCLVERRKELEDGYESLFEFLISEHGFGVDPDNAVVVDDYPPFLESAAQAGFTRLALITQSPGHPGPPPRWRGLVVSSLRELQTMLAGTS
jgi:FMN phosphatase YigB (HAD superfamily)